jgi:hypothetical protein
VFVITVIVVVVVAAATAAVVLVIVVVPHYLYINLFAKTTTIKVQRWKSTIFYSLSQMHSYLLI